MTPSKVCGKSGKCKISEADKKKKGTRKGGKGARKGKKVSDSAIASAVMRNVGTDTQVSLATKRRSKKLGAGMETMVALTKDQMAMQKVCRPRKGTKQGRPYTYETVPMERGGKIRCVKAGGKLAKEVLGTAGCPAGKVLKPFSRCLPDSRTSTRQKHPQGLTKGKCKKGFVEEKYQRCVKAVRQYKDCPANQVLVEDRIGRRCMLPSTAAKKGLAVISYGTLPVRRRASRVARSTGL